MNAISVRCKRSVVAVLAVLVFSATVCSAVSAQEKRAGQTSQSSGVDNTKMGPYRALAQNVFSEFQKGDLATAAQLARVLERVWDKSEDYGGDMALKKTHPNLFDEIDRAMDEFVLPLMEYKTKPPESSRVKAAYSNYLEKLRLAD